MLQVSELHVQYGSITALQGISLEVKKGEIVGILGPNGAGKSTTLFAIMGSVRPARGDIIFDGRSLVGKVPEAIARYGISLVPENRHIFTTLTIEENLRVGAAARKDRKRALDDIQRVLERFPYLQKNLSASAAGLSGGEQQQLAIARALLSRPSFLLLDEPSLGLAPFLVDRVFELIEELREAGTTILLVEQTVQRTFDVADRIYVLRRGRVEVAGTPAEVAAAPAFEASYLGIRAPGTRASAGS